MDRRTNRRTGRRMTDRRREADGKRRMARTLGALLTLALVILARPGIAAASASYSPGAGGGTTEADAPGVGAASEAPADPSSGTVAAGTAVLMGAGLYTAARKQWNEKKNSKREYVYFENHTKNKTLRDEEKYVD